MTVADDLATLRDHLPTDYLGPDPNDMDGEKWGQHPEALAALDRVETEIARLAEESESNFHAFLDERDKAVAAEAEVARLRDGLREIRDGLVPYPYSPQFLKDKARALLAEDGAAGLHEDLPGERFE